MKFGPKETKELNEYLRTGRNRTREFMADLVDDLEPGSLKDELLKDFDPSQETYEEYLQRKSLERPFNMADGGRIGFRKGGFEQMNLERRRAAFNNLKLIYGKKYVEDMFKKDHGISFEEIIKKKEHNGRTVTNIIDGFKKKITKYKSPNPRKKTPGSVLRKPYSPDIEQRIIKLHQVDKLGAEAIAKKLTAEFGKNFSRPAIGKRITALKAEGLIKEIPYAERAAAINQRGEFFGKPASEKYMTIREVRDIDRTTKFISGPQAGKLKNNRSNIPVPSLNPARPPCAALNFSLSLSSSSINSCSSSGFKSLTGLPNISLDMSSFSSPKDPAIIIPSPSFKPIRPPSAFLTMGSTASKICLASSDVRFLYIPSRLIIKLISSFTLCGFFISLIFLIAYSINLGLVFSMPMIPACSPPMIDLVGSIFLPFRSKRSATFSLPLLMILPALSFIPVMYLSSNS